MRVLICLFFIALSIKNHGQEPPIGAQEKVVFQNTAQESIFVHYNSSLYMVGEYMYFKVYCLDAKTKRLSRISKVAYLTLINKGGERVFQQKIRLQDGFGQGDFFLPVDTPSGSYKLVAYTKWMGNWGQESFFQDDVIILNPYSNQQKDFIEQGTVKNGFGSDTRIPKVLEPGESTIRMIPSKKKFGKREPVTLAIKGTGSKKIPDGEYSISVRKSDAIFPNWKKTTSSHIALTQVSTPTFEGNIILPELRGELISGKVITTDPNQSKDNLKVALSIPGKDYQLKIAKTDSLGQFYFNIDKPYLADNVIIQILEEQVDGLTLKMDEDPIAINTNEVQFKSFELSPEMNELILKRSIQNQVENAYFEVKPDTVVSQAGKLNFYGKKAKVFLLDDYTRFPTIKETALEILDNVWLSQTKEDKYFFRLRTLNGEFDNSEFKSLLVVDGIFVKDQDAFIRNFSANLIERINVVRQYYRMGSQIFDGIVDIQTFDFKYQTSAKENGFLALQLDRQTEIKNYFRQIYSDSTKKTLARVPDLRSQLLWLPSLNVEQDETVTFFTSDVSGNFEISLEGITDGGEPISLKETIFVE
ncbi:MAG: hypothetical protein AAGJ12_00715 [Bacteroidota bacterium]